ncbi:3-methyl-2-oxobutanoate hydroxymethyltransferase [Planoprotostelium fungivorum]|uniref:3-methyl-2-oxobutanoate hydroxymethyltransferase n=1 Tax=Planoprotostelium fungivorum TaxID=1890364 RepID=A0A2P6MZC8_9EUKA|nr:3-methyl-2-oxobutanoate hydroxymethyltransferase [Planoprotostelium fungivorum]
MIKLDCSVLWKIILKHNIHLIGSIHLVGKLAFEISSRVTEIPKLNPLFGESEAVLPASENSVPSQITNPNNRQPLIIMFSTRALFRKLNDSVTLDETNRIKSKAHRLRRHVCTCASVSQTTCSRQSVDVQSPRRQTMGSSRPRSLTPSSFSHSDGIRRRGYSTHADKPQKKGLPDLMNKYQSHTPITMVTAYDYTGAYNVDAAGIDMLLVGDSLAMTMMGHDSTHHVTMDEMLHHCKAVANGVHSSFVVGDMPFGSYEVSPQEAARNAIRLVKEGRVDAIKLEGGKRVVESVRSIVAAGITVVGHIGLTPQTATALGGFKAQGRTANEAKRLLEDALALQESGASFLVMECVPEILASHVTKQLQIPTIGIGAGLGCSGQVLVYHDMLGIYPKFTPKFSKQYADLGSQVRKALTEFRNEVTNRTFPAKQHTFNMKTEEFSAAFPEVEVANQKPKKVKPAAPLFITPEPKKVITVVGGGAMASLVCARLAATGQHDVWMISSWAEHMDIINRSGLIIQNTDRSTQRVHFRATATPDEVLQTSGPSDLTIVLVKSPQTQQAAQVAARVTRCGTGAVLTLQNGVGNREILSEAVSDPEMVVQGVTSQASYVVQSGLVWHTGHGPTTISGNHRSTTLIADVLTRAGIPCGMSDNLDKMLWSKLIVNAGINPLTALLRVKNGVIAENTRALGILRETVREGVEVAHARGIDIAGPEQSLENVLAVARATRDNTSSMLVDLMRGATTEIESINGAIVRDGEKYHVPTKTNRMLCDLVSMAGGISTPLLI